MSANAHGLARDDASAGMLARARYMTTTWRKAESDLQLSNLEKNLLANESSFSGPLVPRLICSPYHEAIASLAGVSERIADFNVLPSAKLAVYL